MLQAIKGSIASPWLRYSLFGVLILSFGVWGIGDVLRRLVSPTSEVLAEGEGIAIDRQSFANHWQRATAAFRAQGLTNQQLLAGPLPRLVLDRLIGQALLQGAVRDLGLSVPASVLQQTIAEEPLFVGEDGRFESWRFVAFLRQAGLSEQGYLQELQTRLLQSSLLESLSFELSLPQPFLRELLAAEQEQREIEILRVPLPPLATLADPGDEKLKAFMEKEQVLFRLPEYRRFAYATLSPTTETSLDEAAVRAYYKEHQEEIREKEKRSFQQMFFIEENAARESEAALKSGKNINKSIKEIAEKFSTTPVFVTEQEREDLLDDAVANSVFGMTQKGDLAVTQGSLGWYLLRLESIVPTSVPSFDSVRAALTKQLQQERAAQRYGEAVAQAEDMLFAGASLEEAAETLGLKVETTPFVDAASFLTNGVEASLWQQLSKEEARELLTLGFALQSEGETSQAFEIERKDGRIEALFLEVREMQETRLADLTQKRSAVLAVYQDLTRREQQQARTKKLAEAIRREGLSAVARREGLSVSRKTVARESQEWEMSFLTSLFVAQKNDVLTAGGEGGDVVVRLVAVRRPDTESFSVSQIDKFAKRLAAETALPLGSYRQALQVSAKLRLDEEAFAEFVSTGLAP